MIAGDLAASGRIHVHHVHHLRGLDDETHVDIGPRRSVESWVHAAASTATLVGIAVVARPLVTLPLHTGETMLRCGLGVLFLVCMLRLLHQGMWSLGGREHFEVTPHAFILRTTWFGIGRERRFPLRAVTNIRAKDRLAPSRRGKRRVLARTIAFDVEGRTLKGTMNLTVPEAAFLTSALKLAVDQSRREAARTYRT